MKKEASAKIIQFPKRLKMPKAIITPSVKNTISPEKALNPSLSALQKNTNIRSQFTSGKSFIAMGIDCQERT